MVTEGHASYEGKNYSKNIFEEENSIDIAYDLYFKKMQIIEDRVRIEETKKMLESIIKK